MDPKPMMCRHCRRVLLVNRHYVAEQLVGVTYEHGPAFPGVVCLEADPIPLEEADSLRTCDFCGQAMADEEWEHYAEDFNVEFIDTARSERVTWKSRGNWAACGRCHELIGEDAWDQLLIRCRKMLQDGFSPVFIAKAHAGFRAHASVKAPVRWR